jgi:hypothetical protein
MDKPLIETLAERVESLERENRRLRRYATAALIGGAVLLVGGAQKADAPKTVEAERFVVRDKDGAVRVTMEALEDHHAGLFIKDVEGRTRIHLGSDGQRNGPAGLSFRTREGHNRIRLLVAPETNNPTLDLLDEKGQPVFRAQQPPPIDPPSAE